MATEAEDNRKIAVSKSNGKNALMHGWMWDDNANETTHLAATIVNLHHLMSFLHPHPSIHYPLVIFHHVLDPLMVLVVVVLCLWLLYDGDDNSELLAREINFEKWICNGNRGHIFCTGLGHHKISGIQKFGQKILSKMRERVHHKFQDPHFSCVTASQKSGITILVMHLQF